MVDFAGNELDPPYEEEIDGLFGGVLRFLEALWDFLVGVMADIAEGVAKALTMLIEWIVNLFVDAITALMDGLVSLLTPMIQNLVEAIVGIADGKDTNDMSKVAMLTPLILLAWVPIRRTQYIFSGIEFAEVGISAILTGTGIGGAIKPILSKIGMETIKNALKTLLVVFAVSAIGEAIGEIRDTDDLKPVLNGWFLGASAFIVTVILGVIEAYELMMKKRMGKLDIPVSKYATAVGLAIFSIALETAGYIMLNGLGLDHGVYLFVLDAIAVATAVFAMTTLIGNFVIKVRTDGFMNTLIQGFASFTSGIETVLTMASGPAAILSSVAHGIDGRYSE